jgi:hypothetical protein
MSLTDEIIQGKAVNITLRKEEIMRAYEAFSEMHILAMGPHERNSILRLLRFFHGIMAQAGVEPKENE